VSNPTNPFSWQMPTPTDLVTDLPADFEVFGQAVATSLADLLGGTTDQVLAKNSNTDMDFKWVTSDDANAIQNSIVNAKGDLIGASANDTPAILSVGANDLVLTAASGEATGLKYAGAWTSYTPTWAGITVGNATITAKYCQVGKLVTVAVKLVAGSTTSFPSGFVQVSGPITGVVMPSRIVGRVYYEDAGVAAYLGAVKQDAASAFAIVPEIVSGTYSTFGNTSSTVPFTWGTGDIFEAYFSYEAA
jgi:hypothetical protein